MTRWFSTLGVLALAGVAADGGRAFATQIDGTGHAARQASHTSHAAGTSADAAIKNVFWQPNAMQQGSVAFFTVELEHAPRKVTATWIGKTLSFFHSDDARVWYALAGADLGTQPGSYELRVTAILPSGKVARSMKKVDVDAGTFTTGAVDVPENYVEPNEEEKKQIAADQVLKTRAFAHAGAAPMWSGNFVPAVNAKSTPSFGESRILNEEKTSLHRGTDFPVPEGTPVVAANSGTVVLAKELYYEGNCVIVDHGQKFFTIYMHLSKMEVAAEDKVAKGKRLGLSGATGRVTGPHLHLGVRWDGAYIDPVGLLAMTLPKTAAGAGEKGRRAAAHKAVKRHRGA